MTIHAASKALLTKITSIREDRAERARIRKTEPYAPGRFLVHPGGDTTTAYWLLNDVRTQGRHPADLDRAIRQSASMWSGLAGDRFTLHMWHVPFDGEAFRTAQVREFPDADEAHIDADVRLATNQRWNAARWVCVLGVEITDHAVAREDVHLCEPGAPLPDNKHMFAAVQEKVERLDQYLSDYGTPRGSAQITDMWREFTRMGMPCDVTPSADAFQPSVTLTGLADGDRVESFVPVLRVAAVPERVDTATAIPWGQWLGAMSGAVYVAIQGRVSDGASLRFNAELKNRENRSHGRADREAGYDARPEVEKGQASAKRYRQDVNSTDPSRSTHLDFVVKVALPRATHAEAVKAVREVTKAARNRVALELEHGLGQYEDWASMAPGQRWRLNAHVNQENALAFSAAFPNASNVAGSDVGMVAGPIHGSREVLIIDWRKAMRAKTGAARQASGATIIVGEPGTGKTALLGRCMYDEVKKGGGAFATDSSPNSSLARLARTMGGRILPITTEAPPGALMPSVVIPVPAKTADETDIEYRAAVAAADAGRVELTETMVAAVAWELESLPGFREAITIACTTVGGGYGVHSREVIDALAAIDTDSREVAEVGKRIATLLRAKADTLEGRLVFPDVDVDADQVAALVSSSRITVVTMPGLEVPEGAREHWTPGMRRAVPVLIGAARLSELAMWAPNTAVTMVGNDELGITLAGSSAMSSQVARTFYAVRKLGIAAFFITQTLAPYARLGDDAIKDIAGQVITGAARGDTNPAEVARYMGLSPQHAAVLPHLRTGEFIANLPDEDGVRFSLELNHLPREIRAALNTTPVQEATVMDALWARTARAVTM